MSNYMGCGSQLSKENLEQKLKELEFTGRYIMEEKLDGQWAEVLVEKGVVKSIISRDDKIKNYEALLNYKFPEYLSGILVGEMGYGSSNINMQKKVFVIYDFVWIYDGRYGGDSIRYDGTQMENQSRRHVLMHLISTRSEEKVCLVRRWDDCFWGTYQILLREGNEGGVIKEKCGPNTFYIPGTRPENQIKVKKECIVDMVVMDVGWRNPEAMSELTKRKGLGSAIRCVSCGQFRDGKLVKEVEVGSMGEEARIWFTNNLELVKSCTLVVEVKGFGQWEKSGSIRHPSLVTRPDGKWLREDLKPEDCVFGKIRII